MFPCLTGPLFIANCNERKRWKSVSFATKNWQDRCVYWTGDLINYRIVSLNSDTSVCLPCPHIVFPTVVLFFTKCQHNGIIMFQCTSHLASSSLCSSDALPLFFSPLPVMKSSCNLKVTVGSASWNFPIVHLQYRAGCCFISQILTGSLRIWERELMPDGWMMDAVERWTCSIWSTAWNQARLLLHITIFWSATAMANLSNNPGGAPKWDLFTFKWESLNYAIVIMQRRNVKDIFVVPQNNRL